MSSPNTLRKALPSIRRIIERFWPYIRQHRLLAGGSMLGLFAEVGFRLLEPWPLKFVIDRVVDVGPAPGAADPAFIESLPPLTLLTLAAVAVVVIIALRALAAYCSTVGFALVGTRVLTQVRGDLYRHLQRLSLSFHTKQKSGDMTVRLISDIGLLKDVIVTAFLPLFGNVLILVGMIVVMLILNWQLALLGLITLPVFALLTARIGRKIHKVSRQQRQREGAMAATAAESIGSIKAVQALSLENSFDEAFSGENDKSLTQDVRAKRLAASLERSADVLVGISTALVLWFGARLVLSGALSPGDLLVFLTYLKNAFKPVRDFAKYAGRLAKAAAAGERVLDLLEREPQVRDRPDARPAGAFRGDIRFENVSFEYETGDKVLVDVDFEAKAGQRVALVGLSGNGKSTIASLILRLYDPTEGSITIDGRDIRDYTLESLRTRMSVVLQDSLLFAGTIRENIGYGAFDGAESRVTDDDIENAARLANAHAFIQALPEGYETVVGERGVTLSGGQRQRIAIARAAVREAPILILDEPTTGLDRENERKVVDALERLAVGRTTLLISHDLHLAARADRLLYVEDGRILESGTHEELMRENGRYAILYRLQAAKQEIESGEEPSAYAR